MKRETKTLLTAIAIPLAVGGVSGFLTRNSMSTFQKLKKPPLSPPGWFFPVFQKGGGFAGALSGVADLCGISEFDDQYFELKWLRWK